MLARSRTRKSCRCLQLITLAIALCCAQAQEPTSQFPLQTSPSDQQATTAIDTMPLRYCLPTAQRPFVFFHQRATGGVSLATQIDKTCQQQNYTAAIACHNKVTCTPELERRTWKQQVLAGHFTWSHVFSALPYRTPAPDIPCVTIFRHPLERIRSCFYIQWRTLVDWSELTPPQILKILTTIRSEAGYGCVNEPVRLFSGFTDETAINDLVNDPTLSSHLTKLSQRNLAKCVVLMQTDLNHPRTAKILSYWFPWLQVLPMGQKKDNSDRKPRSEPMTAEQEAMIRTVAAPEFELFQWARQRYIQQLRHIRKGEAPPCV